MKRIDSGWIALIILCIVYLGLGYVGGCIGGEHGFQLAETARVKFLRQVVARKDLEVKEYQARLDELREIRLEVLRDIENALSELAKSIKDGQY